MHALFTLCVYFVCSLSITLLMILTNAIYIHTCIYVMQLEEHFTSLQEEVEAKTRKLKRLLGKYQAAVQESKDLQEEFQVRRRK